MLMAKRKLRHLATLFSVTAPNRGRENDELQVRGSPSWLGLLYLAHSRSRIYGRNRLSIASPHSLVSGLGPYMTKAKVERAQRANQEAGTGFARAKLSETRSSRR